MVLSPTIILIFILSYFLLLFIVSRLTGKNADNNSFFIGNHKSPWYLVAYGMIGASLSGATFISIPGQVGSSNWAYMQMALGYPLGYFFISVVLIPLYYKLNLTSIYSYLKQRLGKYSHKTGAFYFLISKFIGAAFRLYLACLVLQEFVFSALGIPFVVTAFISIALIWLYTYKSGIKSIVWTDTFQTTFMVGAVIVTIYIICQEMEFNLFDLYTAIKNSSYSKTFFTDDPKSFLYFPKYFLGGAFIAIAMTGMDQDMMQKNLSCKNIKEAQKNMLWFNIVLLVVNTLFMSLGVALYLFANHKGMAIPEKTDLLYPIIARDYLGLFGGAMFFIGLIAAAYSSADSALTALTTSFCIDFLGYDDSNKILNVQTRKYVHIGVSFVLFLVIVIFHLVNDSAVINALFIAAGYTYGPLLGLFFFGLFTKRQSREKMVPIICIISPIICFLLNQYSLNLLGGYKIGFELLILNGALTFILLLIFSKKAS